jgi:hypothetical protein
MFTSRKLPVLRQRFLAVGRVPQRFVDDNETGFVVERPVEGASRNR